MREYTPDPRLYELMTILSPDVPEDELPAQIETIAGYISNAGGTVNETLRESPWGRRRLAYSIRHAGRDIRDGFYTVYHFTLDPNGVRDIERDLKLNDQVMRFLITHYTPKAETPGETTDGGAEGTVDGETPVAAEESTPEEAATEAAGTEDGNNEAIEARAADAAAAESMEAGAAASESAPATESVTDTAVPAETSDTEAAATPEVAEVEAAAPTEETPATDENPAEPPAPAKDDEEA